MMAAKRLPDEAVEGAALAASQRGRLAWATPIFSPTFMTHLAVQQAEGGAVVEWGDLVAGEYPA
jgi:hypothetical protein